MRKLLPFAAMLCLFAGIGSRADEKIAAPVPKPQDAPEIDGTYIVNYSTFVTTSGPWGGGKGGVRPAPETRSVLRTTGATISKGEIALGGNYDSDGYYDRYGPGGGGGSTNQTMTYAIDPKATPMTIDVFTIDARNKKQKALGIIEVVDGRITIALAKPGADRPKNIEETEEVTVYYFKKAPPPPKTEFKIVAMTVGKEADAEKELNKLAKEGYELVNSTNPASADGKAAPTTVHFILKKTTGGRPQP